MRRGSMVLLAVIAVIVVAGLFVYGSFKSTQNQLVQKEENVKQSWSEVDVDLQRRADLIPNLVETVKGFTKEENTVFARHRQCARGPAELVHSARQDRRQRPPGFGVWPAPGADGKLSAIALERAVHALAG